MKDSALLSEDICSDGGEALKHVETVYLKMWSSVKHEAYRL